MMTNRIVTLAMCLFASAGRCAFAGAAALFAEEDAVCVVQAAVTVADEEERLAAGAKGGSKPRRGGEGRGREGADEGGELGGEVPTPRRIASGPSAAPDDCGSQVQLDLGRSVQTNNLGGLGPGGGDPVIHIQRFVDLKDGRIADLVVSNLTEYTAIRTFKNGLEGEFNNVNLIAGFVELLLTFKDTATQAPISMPAFNLTIYDIDGPAHAVDTETVEMLKDEYTSYELTDTTTVVVSETATKISFGSSAWGIGCDNPSTIETTGPIEGIGCQTGAMNQMDRAVGLQMKGGRSSYHVTLRAGPAAVKGRNYLFGIPAYFNKVCHASPVPTASPTSSPPTSSPTGSPTSSPSHSPTASPSYPPTMSPSNSPTMSPSNSPTSSPTGSPSSSPTMSPSNSPTSSPTGSPSSSPTMSPSSSPTLSPSYSPTSFPTLSPTSSAVTSFGDPHVTNLKGERFDILQPDYHTFLVIPRGAEEEHALLHVVAKVDPLGQPCSGLLYVTGLRFSGGWVGDIGSLEFSTSVHAPMAATAMKIKPGASSYLNASQFSEAVPRNLAEVTVFQPQEPLSLSQHVDLLLVKLKLGPSIAKVRMVYQKEKVGFSNSLWLTTTGLGRVNGEIGGILGLDDHTLAASKPEQCLQPDSAAASALFLSLPAPHGSVHASASLEDEDVDG